MYLFTHPHRSTYESIHPACQTQQSISVCLSPLFTYPFFHPHQCAYPVACVCLSISIDSSPCTHVPISIRSITDCSEGWEEARHTHLLWSPEVPGLAQHRRFIDDVGGGHSLPACQWPSDAQRPKHAVRHDSAWPGLPVPAQWTRSTHRRRHTQGSHWMRWGHTRSYADSSTPPILEQISLSKLNRALIIIIMPASFKLALFDRWIRALRYL